MSPLSPRRHTQGIYYIAVSGVLYDIIRGVPPFGFDPVKKRMIFFAQSSGTQYVVEGLIIGGANVLAALSAVLLVRVVPKLANEQWRVGATVLCSMGVVGGFWFNLMQYTYKNPWYSMANLFRTMG